MASIEHSQCYGKMFPNIADHRTDQRILGQAFWFERKSVGGMPFAPPMVGVDAEGWDRCRSCPEFEHCYRLCMGELALGSVVKSS